MKTCVLDGSDLPDAAAVYATLAGAFGFPPYFGNNPDALWDALGDHAGGPVAVVWRDAARSAKLLGPDFDTIVAVLQRAATLGILKFDLA
jgi:RNAse (barnase) inhibitor barstar